MQKGKVIGEASSNQRNHQAIKRIRLGCFFIAAFGTNGSKPP